jgi:hypothetical protein
MIYVVSVTIVQADISDTIVYVCTGSGGDYPCATEPYGPISYDGDYVPQVLANEWPADAGEQSLQAGAITIRTFGWRKPGCGAIWDYKTEGYIQYRIEHNSSQAYWGCCTPEVQHYAAVTATRDLTLRNHTNNTYICAKYKADCGTPTADGADEAWTLVGVPDPVDSDNGGYFRSGLSQNGTHAWELADYDGAAPWDYRQMLTHYYAQTSMTGLAFNRWTWLDADIDGGIRYTSLWGEEYYGSLAQTPTTMYTARAYEVPFHIQNTGAYAWQGEGAYAEYLSYHWYDSARRLFMWEGISNTLGTSIVYPSRDISLTATVVAPWSPGVYRLEWDMRSSEYWFSQSYGGWPTQAITVTVQASPGFEVLPCVSNRNNWVSTVSLHNPSSTAWLSADISYVTTQNNMVDVASYDIGPGNTITATPPEGFWGIAVIGASQDVDASISPTCKRIFLSMVIGGVPTQ